MYSAAKQELVDRGARAALEQHRPRRLADCFEQAVVLHVARADLQHVGVFGDQRHVLAGDDFGHDGEAGFGAGLGQQLEAVFLHALEAVGAGPRLERSAAKRGGAGLLDRDEPRR